MTDAEKAELVEALADAFERVTGPVFGSPEYLADPVKLARAEKRRRDGALAYARACLPIVEAKLAAAVAEERERWAKWVEKHGSGDDIANHETACGIRSLKETPNGR